MVKDLSCDYYFCDDSNINLQSNYALSITSYNISSIPLHFDSFCDQCINTLNINFDVIGLCETRLNNNISSIYCIDKYNSFYQNKNTSGGGLAIYLKKTASR